MRMPFGKHRGTPVDELPENYLTWVWENVRLREPLRSAVEDALFLSCPPAPMPDQDVVKSIYRELAMKWHPDRGGTTSAMQAVNEFYERLTMRREF